MFGLNASRRTKAGLAFTVMAGGGLFLLPLFLASRQTGSASVADASPAISLSGEPIQPLALPANLDAAKVRLGRELFHEPRLSVDSSVSCASCHDLRTGGIDRRTVSEGIYHRHGTRNAPSVFNVGLNYRQFWDGRAASLEAQVDGPLQDQNEMGSTWRDALAKLRQDAHYTSEFHACYPEGIEPETVRDAIATFERSLVTPDSRFDRFLRGEKTAISATELTGYRLFKSLGCVSCHQGRNVGGGMMQPFGALQSPDMRGTGSGANETVARENPQETLYKVPSLRNVARTAPYFHDGSIDSLPRAVRIMSDAQLCRHLSDEEVRQIVAFLQTLTGTYEGRPL